MKNLKKYFLLLIGILFLCYSYSLFAGGIIDIDDPSGLIENNSITRGTANDLNTNIESVGIGILGIIKLIVQGILIIFIVYTGIQMIMSMGSDEEELSSSKRQLRYAIVGVFFINIPGTLFNVFDTRGSVGGQGISSGSFLSSGNSGLLVTGNFSNVFYMIIHFLEVVVFFAAIFVFILAGIQILTSRGRDEKIKEGKNKIFYGTLGLVFVGIIESWKYIAFRGDIVGGVGLFNTLLQIALFFAGITVIFFLSLAGYYAITSAGDEEKIKKSKNIVINVLIGILILILSYTFLVDLITL